MRNAVFVVVVACLLTWTSGVVADEDRSNRQKSPESLVTCAGGNGDTVAIASVVDAISLESCSPYSDQCAVCINPLENQGCKIVDVVVTHFLEFKTIASYLLSCTRP